MSTAPEEAPRFPFPPSPVPYDPAPQTRDLRAKCPVSQVRLPDDSTAWLVMGFNEMREALTDQRYSRALLFKSDRELRGLERYAAGGILSMDPPEHSRLRKLVAAAFTDRRIQALRPRVARIVDDLVDAILAGPRPADLSGAFSFALPASVLCLLFGVPTADMEKFQEWTNTILGDWSRPPEILEAAFAAMSGYMSELIARKRKTPEDDLISVLVDARDSAGKLTEDELVLFCITLLTAGLQTTANTINMSFVALCQHPDQLARLRDDPGLIPGAVEELLRYVNITGSGGIPLARVTREEVCLAGVTIPAGERVLPVFIYANRDPAAFDDPDRLDVGREPRTHMSFGAGAHHCVGSQLARLELQEAFRGLLTRLPGLRMAVPMSALEFREGQNIFSMRELPVTWDGA
ncbi:MAG: cytochrome P450 [Nocardiopsaceae bacterium]|nr:cytochrome P450 [Nocardiopsaceae bacterium]